MIYPLCIVFLFSALSLIASQAPLNLVQGTPEFEGLNELATEINLLVENSKSSKAGNLRNSILPLPEATPSFDFYVFSLSWGPTYCISHGNVADCYRRLQSLSQQYKLLVHGLWPSRKDGKMLGDCNTGPQIQVVKTSSEPFSTMNEVWPSLKNSRFAEFWGHEYNKHGFCYSSKMGQGNDYSAYFSKALALYSNGGYKNLIEKAVGIHPGQEVAFTYAELMQKFTGVLGSQYFELECTTNASAQYLSEVRFYYDLDFNKLKGFKYHSNCRQGEIIIQFEERRGSYSTNNHNENDNSNNQLEFLA